MIYARQISIMGTRGIAASRFPSLFEMIAAGRIDPARLVTRTIALAGAGAALAAMSSYSRTGITVIDMAKEAA
jgi:alcohol dehydrogenase